MTALDVGCGNGRNSVGLATLGFQNVIAVDPLHEFITATADQAHLAGVAIDTRHGRLPELPCETASIDLAVAWGMLFVLGDPQATRRAMSELHRVVRPGGYLVADWRTEADSLLNDSAERVADCTHLLNSTAPADLAGKVYSFYTAEQVRAFHHNANFDLLALQREELRDVLNETSYSWWQTCAQRSMN